MSTATTCLNKINKMGIKQISTAVFLMAACASTAFAQAQSGWTRDVYIKAMKDSGRPVDVSESQFAEIQKRRVAGLKRTEAYLKERFGEADPAVLKAFS